MKKNFRQEVYRIVRKIPKGKVATYGQIAEIIQSSPFLRQGRQCKVQSDKSKLKVSPRFMPRLVGYCLHQNRDPKVPCHRVVDRNGRLAPNFAFDGVEEQEHRLLVEGVQFKDEKHVDLAKYLWQENSKF